MNECAQHGTYASQRGAIIIRDNEMDLNDHSIKNKQKIVRTQLALLFVFMFESVSIVLGDSDRFWCA